MAESAQDERRVVIVTGGAQGIGRAIVELFLDRGYAAAIADIDEALGRKAADELGRDGRVVSAVAVDVTDKGSVRAMVRTVLDRYGRIDALVNNAGIAGRAAPLVEIDEELWNKVLAVDLNSVYLCSQAVLPHMLERGSGSIVNVASIAGKEGNPNMVPYSAAKAGVIGFTKALAKEVAQKGVRVNAVSPAVIETAILSQLTPEQVKYMKDRIPMGRFGKPSEVAEVVAFLAADGSSFVTGQCYDISGGRSSY